MVRGQVKYEESRITEQYLYCIALHFRKQYIRAKNIYEWQGYIATLEVAGTIKSQKLSSHIA